MQTITVNRSDLVAPGENKDWALAVMWYASLIKGYGLNVSKISGANGLNTITVNPDLPQADYDDLTTQATTLKSARRTEVDREIVFKYVNGSEVTLTALE